MPASHCPSSLPALLLASLCFTAAALGTDKGLTAPGTGISKFLPFDMPPYSSLVESPKKVFPHWHLYKLSWDNKDPENDFYMNSVCVTEGPYPNKGRQRALPRPVRSETDWKVLDMMHEIALAKDIGCDGFWMNHFGNDNDHIDPMLEAARRMNSEFKILLAQDCVGYMPQLRKSTLARVGPATEYYSDLYAQYGKHPFAYRVDGKLALSAFGSMWVSPEEWAAIFGNLKQEGIEVYFMPIFMGWTEESASFLKSYGPISEGFGDWGRRTPDSAPLYAAAAKQCHEAGKKWIMPVATQDLRVKEDDGRAGIFWESRGSETFRNYWKAAIDSNSDWVQLITWNDYSEGTEIAPSTGTQYAFYDLTAYYLVWFKTGSAPPIVRDVLYYFHRTQFSDAIPSIGKTHRPLESPPVDIIELLGFLKEPGVLRIEIGGKVFEKEAPAGLTSFQIPLQFGRPVFQLVRKGESVISLQSAFTIDDKPALVHDLLYKGGSSTREPVPMVDLYRRFVDFSDPNAKHKRKGGQ